MSKRGRAGDKENRREEEEEEEEEEGEEGGDVHVYPREGAETVVWMEEEGASVPPSRQKVRAQK